MKILNVGTRNLHINYNILQHKYKFSILRNIIIHRVVNIMYAVYSYNLTVDIVDMYSKIIYTT